MFVEAATMQDFYARPEVEQEAIKWAADKMGVSLEDFLNIIEPEQTKGPLDMSSLLVGASSVVALTSLMVASFLWRRQRALEQKLDSSSLQRDALRKEHMGELQRLVENYSARQGAYPVQSEFEKLRGREASLVMDPMEGQERKEGGRFSYYYAQKKPEDEKVDASYYRLWCFLENERDKDAQGEKYILEP